MKKLIFILLLFISGYSQSQTVRANDVVADRNLYAPVFDTLVAPGRVGDLRVRVQDTALYMSISMTAPKKWQKILKLTDVVATDISGKLNISDTSGMLSPYIHNGLYGLLKSGQRLYLDSALVFPQIRATIPTYTETDPLALKIANNLSDGVAATMRTNLGLGTLATQSGTFSGTSSGTNTGDNATNSQYSGLVTMTYPGAGIPKSNGVGWDPSYSTTGSGTVVALGTNPTLVGFTQTADANVNAAKIIFNPTAASELMRINVPTAYVGSAPYQITIQNVINPDGSYNTPVLHGFNSGRSFDATRSGNWISMENNYNPAGTKFMEYHYEIGLPNVTSSRLFSSTFVEGATLAASSNTWDFRGDIFHIYNLTGSTAYASFGGSTTNGSWDATFRSPTGLNGLMFTGGGAANDVSVNAVTGTNAASFIMGNWAELRPPPTVRFTSNTARIYGPGASSTLAITAGNVLGEGAYIKMNGSAANGDLELHYDKNGTGVNGIIMKSHFAGGNVEQVGVFTSNGSDNVYWKGSSVASGNLNLSSTTHATKGKIKFGTLSAYDEVNDRLGIGTVSPGRILNTLAGRNDATIRIQSSETGASTISAGIEIGNSNGGSFNQMGMFRSVDGEVQVVNNVGNIVFYPTGTTGVSAGTAAMSILRTSGNVLIGSTTDQSTGKLQVTGAASITTSLTTPLLIGGTGTTSTLTYKTTTGVGATGADHIFLVGNNGGTRGLTIFNSGNVSMKTDVLFGFTGSTEPTVSTYSFSGSSTLTILNVPTGGAIQTRINNAAISTFDASGLRMNGADLAGSIRMPVQSVIQFGSAPDYVSYALYGDAVSSILNAPAAGSLSFRIANSAKWNVNTSGHFLAGADNTYDIGAAIGTTAPRTVYASTSVKAPLLWGFNQTLSATVLQTSSNGSAGWKIENAGGGNGYQTMTGHSVNTATIKFSPTSNQVSTSAILLSDSWYAAGTSTTTKPQLLIEPTGTTSNAWGTSGTGIGLNAASGFAGNLIDAQVAAVSQFAVGSNGKLTIATGSNKSVGVSGAMTAGTITISTTAVTASSIIILTHATLGGVQGILSVGTITAGTSFVINSSSSADTGTINWWIIN